MTHSLSDEQASGSTDTYQNLLAEHIPLQGTHLIEASAGTGKTYNITRLYLRMLLERKLPVEKILVMTFTKDATQELTGRIDSAIRDTLNNWHQLIVDDAFFETLSQRISFDEASFLLRKALLFLDEAAIFTIHGFCQRILTEHAFGTNMSFNAVLETDLSELTEQACQDWYRTLAITSPKDFILLTQFWSSPASLLNHFNKAIQLTAPLNVLSPEVVEQAFMEEVRRAIHSLNEHQGLIEQALIDNQKGAKQTERTAEFNELKQWLIDLLTDLSLKDESENVDLENVSLEVIAIESLEHKNSNNQKNDNTNKQPINHNNAALSVTMPTSFFNGTRYSRSPVKAELLIAFEPLKTVKTSLASYNKNIDKAKAYQIVRDGIYQIRINIEKQKQQQHVLGFDDLIANLAHALTNNSALTTRVRESYPVALVDEFQDTDPQQFTILKCLYKPGCTQALYMIGDPKQAIYGFRGGDVFAYLAARSKADYQWLMDTNWRSSPLMITAYNRLFNGAPLSTNPHQVFGYGIPYLPVNASPKAKNELCETHLGKDDSKDSGTHNSINKSKQALQFVHFTSEQSTNSKGHVGQSFRPKMAMWCANEISRLLNVNIASGNTLQPKDIAILVRDGTEAKEVKAALEEQGLACVYLSNRSDLFQSQQAQQLFMLLRGILFIENERYYSQALTCPLLGYHAQAYYQLQQNEMAWQQLKNSMLTLRKHWLKKGFMSMALTLMHEHFTLTMADKDRVLTNILHLFELLQTASQRHRQPHELLFWFSQHIQGEGRLSETELRLESDDDLIKIVTQHGSKGLEYPVVFVPFASRYKHPLKLGIKNIHLIEYHDANNTLQMSLDASAEAKAAMVAENHAETIRLLYVAITRAEQRCYLLTTDFENAHLSPIGVTLNSASPLTSSTSSRPSVPLLQSLTALSHELPTAIGLQVIDGDQVTLTLDYEKSMKTNHAEVAKFTSKIERDWWLSSFTALSRNSRHIGISTPDRDADLLLVEEENNSHLIQFNLVKGAKTGNFLHEVLELTDFHQPNWQQSLQVPFIKYHHILNDYNEDELITWLDQIVDAPLGEAGCLRDIKSDSCLRETEFYFPMVNSDIKQLANILTEHRNNKAALRSDNTQTLPVYLPDYRGLKGMMHGFIDLIFQANGKFYVCDYKSNHLGEQFSDYTPSKLSENIEQHYYDLQYLIYSLALHRYLQTSLDDYQVERDFGGVYYLYLRGMSTDKQHYGVQQQTGCDISTGVYYQQLSAIELDQLDNCFKGHNKQHTDVNAQEPLNES
jgi:exodeoxyribonuclease V beta subunit